MRRSSYTLILPKNYGQGVAYRKRLGLKPGQCRIASGSDSIRGLRPTRIVELAGFEKRLDRHAFREVVKRMRGKKDDVEYVKVADDEWPEKPPAPVVVEPDSVDSAEEVAEPAVSSDETSAKYDKGGPLKPALVKAKNETGKDEPVVDPFFEED